MAIAAMKHGLRMLSQPAVRFYNRVGYHAYEGITEDFGERERINRDLGQNKALIMHNHGLLTVGKTAREAFVLMEHLAEAAEIQVKLEATGAELIEIPPDICEKTAAQFETHDRGRGVADWPAYLRILDKDRRELPHLMSSPGLSRMTALDLGAHCPPNTRWPGQARL